MIVVADASPLIALAQVGQLPLLEGLFGEVLVPSAVVREVELSLPSFIREQKLSRPVPVAFCVPPSILAKAKPSAWPSSSASTV